MNREEDIDLGRYLKLEEMLSALPVSVVIDSDRADEFTSRLLSVCKENDYVSHSFYGQNPKVVILGFSHFTFKIDQEKELDKILRGSMMRGDILLCEGMDHCEIVYHLHSGDGLIGKLKDFFSDNDIRTMYNSDSKLMGTALIASSRIVNYEKEHGRNLDDPTNASLMRDYLKSMKQLDHNYSRHEATGIIPLVDGTTKNYRKPSHNAKVFQLVGLAHVYLYFLGENLRENNLAHIMLVPNMFHPINKHIST